MGSHSELYKLVVLDSSTWAVVLIDPARPQLMEIIANFFDEKRAVDYTAQQNGLVEPASLAETEEPVHQSRFLSERSASEANLSPRQAAVLRALRDNLDESNHVAMRAAALAQAARIPLGSLHSVLGSLEKKGLIETARAGSARASAVYRVK